MGAAKQDNQSTQVIDTNDDLLRLITDLSSEAVFLLLANGSVQYYNPRALEISNLTEEVLLSLPFQDLFHPEDRELFVGSKTRLFEQDKSDLVSARIVRKDRSINWFHVRQVPVIWQGNAALLTFLYDITKKVETDTSLKISEHRLKKAQITARMGFLSWDLSADRIYLSEELCHLVGIEPIDEMSSIQFLDTIIHPEDRQMVVENWERAVVGNIRYDFDHRIVRPDGEIRWIHAQAEVETNEFDGQSRHLGTFIDITRRKRAEEMMREKDTRLRILSDASFEGIAITENAVIKDANQQFASYLGYEIDEIIGMNVENFFHPDDHGLIQKMILAGSEEPYEYRAISKNGDVIHLGVRAKMIEEGGKTRRVALIRDITKQKIAEESLRESETRYRTLSEASFEGIAIADKGVILDANRQMAEIIGYDYDDTIGMQISEVVHPDDLDMVQGMIRKGVEQPYEHRVMRKDGQVIYVSVRGKMMEVMGKKIRVTVIKDITEQKESVKRLMESEARFRTLSEASFEGILIAQDSVIKDANNQIAAVFGYEMDELIGTSVNILVYPDDLNIVLNQIIDGKGEPFEHRALHKNGDLIHVESRVKKIIVDGEPRHIAVIKDITDRKRHEEQLVSYSENLESMVHERTHELRMTQDALVRKEKLAILGQLAGSVAHELRNPLTGITNALYYLKLVIPDPEEEVNKCFVVIDEDVQAAAKIISDLLNFATLKATDKQYQSIDQLFAETIEKHPPPEHIGVRVNVEPELPDIFVDRQQMSQVLVNLMSNAYQAMPDGGLLIVKAYQHENEILISLNDNGIGISAEDLERLFDPLFSTKIHGIGLGLAISRNYVEANGGSIEVESMEGVGTTFTIAFEHSN